MKMKASAKSEEIDGIKEKQNIFWGNAVKNKCCFTLIAAILLLTIFGGGYICYRFIKHEHWQNEKINSLQAQISVVKAQVDSQAAIIDWGDGFNYLAIGNSITRCPGFLDEDRGMAASTSDKDYFHIVSTYLEDSLDEDVVSYAFNAAAWEQQANNRGEVLAMGLWDGYLSEKLDLVTIQLSENCSDTTTLEYDFREMVEYVQEKCPNAQIIIVDDFWSDEKSQIKHSAIDGLDVEWADLSEIRGNVEYQVGMGSIVYWNSGEEYVIEHEGVASHPGDNGMMYYAQKIIEQINLDK